MMGKGGASWWKTNFNTDLIWMEIILIKTKKYFKTSDSNTITRFKIYLTGLTLLSTQVDNKKGIALAIHLV